MIKGLSTQRQQQLANLLANTQGIITIDDAQRILSLSRIKAQTLLWTLSRAGWLKAVQSGTYVPVSLDTTDSRMAPENPLLLAQHFFEPCYIGGWTAASFWSMTDQLFQKTWVMTTQRVPHKERSLGENNFILAHIKPDFLFGTAVDWIESHKILYSDPHKTVIDFACFIEDYGLNGFLDTLQAYLNSSHKDVPRLLEYASKAGNRTVFKRLGFGLEKFAPEEEEAIRYCRDNLSQGYSKICPSLECPKIIRRWRLRVPGYLMTHD